ncbi:MAG TPA: shikimate kinase [Chloroflexota bacterium]|nr:shikimate kinase [Chloroflexota bacterium]
MPGNIVLIGFSGTGKTTVSRALAGRLGWDVVDVDQVIVDRLGRSIATVFRDEGELAFRAAESDAIVEACAGSRRVVSVGGGATVDLDNRAIIRDGNLVVRLDATPETILDRLRTSPNAEERPMLAGADPLTRIRALLASRSDAYSIANHIVDTQDKSIEAIVNEIVAVAWPKAGGTGAR